MVVQHGGLRAGRVEPPTSWDEMLEAAQTVNSSGTPFVSIGRRRMVGRPLTDFFENVYLQTAGPEMYDQLSNHEIPWTDEMSSLRWRP